jgi:chromosome partitioning protein
MIVFVPANNKGGVGKTRIAAIFAEYASKIRNKKTLVIDFDPQCNLSQLYLNMEIDPVSPEGYIPPLHPDYDPDSGDSWSGRSSIADIFYDEVHQQGIIPYPTYIENLDIAPAHASRLLAAEAVRKSEVVEKVHNRLADFLSFPEVRAEYDLVVIDTAPSKGPLTVSAIKSATHMIIPSIMEDKPIAGIYGMIQLWKQETFRRESNNPLHLIGILANMFDKRTTLHQEYFDSLKNDSVISKYLMPDILSRRIRFAEVDAIQAQPRSVFDVSNSDQARQEALGVCESIAKRIFHD